MTQPVMLAPGPESGGPFSTGHRATAWRANVIDSGQLIRMLAGLVTVSLVGAVIWAFVAPMPTGVVLRRGYATVPPEQMGRYFDAIGWFCLGLLAIGFIGGSVFWWTARTWRGPLGALALAAATVVASGLAIEVALMVARIRLPDPNTLDAGATFLHAPRLWMAAPTEGAVGAPGILLILMPTMAVLVYLFHALFAPDATLDADSFDDTPAVVSSESV